MKKHCITISLLFLLILCTVSCRIKDKVQDLSITSKILYGGSDLVGMAVDSSAIAILPYDNTEMMFYSKFIECKPSDLTITDLEIIEFLLADYIGQYNVTIEERYNNASEPEKDLYQSIDLKKYKRQYIAVVDNRNERRVWINCFCSFGNIDWHKNVISVMDGGNCFFNLYINLDTRTCYDMTVNGYA